MICQELDQFLYPYLDGEFDATERLDVETHLAGCASCAARVAQESHVQSSLKQRMKGALRPAPASLKASVLKGIHEEQKKLQLASWGRIGAAAMLATAASLAYLHLRPTQDPRDPFLEDAALRHSRRLPYEVQAASPAQLEAWFEGKLNYRVPVPKLTHATLAGARLSNVRDREAAYIGYQASLPPNSEPRRVGVFVFDDSNQELRASAWPAVDVREVRGYHVATWRAGGMVYELVTDLEEPELRGLLAPSAPLAQPALPSVRPLLHPTTPQVVPASLHP
jgi:anti-sigma factor RsiW